MPWVLQQRCLKTPSVPNAEGVFFADNKDLL